ncbi:hypothetical protein K5E40_27925 [Pseudomonas baetica]|uniref:hypothetical protein n=1 Tax=Pseudomonas baetica TaxID=674054 RepID=UPI001C8B0BDC|nr:hypothetical protein [Pseudomonas baetica]MBX9409491.1 hypothetical protein [Pseudomonas baetica]
MSKVFYVPGQTSIIDYAREIAPQVWASRCRMLMLPELRVSHPGAVLGDEEAFLIAQEAALGTQPQEIKAAQYDYALTRLPVLDFAADGKTYSFKLEKYEVGNLTRIYALCDGRYWVFLGLATLTHQMIVERVTMSATGALFDDRQARGSPPH